jgi:hypothetical protein
VKKKLPQQTKEKSLDLFKGVTKQISLIMGAYHCYRPHTKFIQYLFVKVNPACRQNGWYSSVRISTTYQQEQKSSQTKAKHSIQFHLSLQL